MSDADGPEEPPYHLFLDGDEVPVTASALRVLFNDETHEQDIRRLARDVLAALDAPLDEHGRVTVTLSPPQMKITHTAVSLLLGDLQREDADERAVLRAVLDKLPDEHVMRAITIP